MDIMNRKKMIVIEQLISEMPKQIEINRQK